jgi:hypothetical protein
VVVLLALSELGSYVVGKYFVPGSALSFTLYDRSFQPDEASLERYFARRDPVLGWPPVDAYGGDAYDPTGARPLPAFPVPGDACVSLYGDSYTYSSYVGPGDAWGNLLAERLGCRVANYGVSGYGTDQALLRFVRNDADEAATVILGVATVDIIRLVNQDRRLVWDAQAGPLFKPRYVLQGGHLELIGLPAVTAADLADYIRQPERYLSHEWFLPDTPDGPASLRFPFTLSLLRGLTLPRVRHKLEGKPSWIAFYAPTHGSGALALLVELCSEFARVARARGKRALILIIPTSQDLWYARERGADPSAPLIEALSAQAIDLLNVLPAMLQHLGERDVCEVFTQRSWFGQCWGHYNPEGERVIAGVVHERLRAEDADRKTGLSRD